MSTCQLSFNTSLGFISVIEDQGLITHIKFEKIANKKPSLQLLKAKDEIKQFLNKKRKELTFKNKVTGSKNKLKKFLMENVFPIKTSLNKQKYTLV